MLNVILIHRFIRIFFKSLLALALWIVIASGERVTVCGVPFFVSKIRHSALLKLISSHRIERALERLAPVSIEIKI